MSDAAPAGSDAESIDPKRAVLGLAASLAALSALVHLTLGVGNLGGSLVLLAVLFVVAGVAVFGLLAAIALGVVAPPVAYLVGGTLMALHLIAYADVHAFGVFESVSGVGLHDHGTDDSYSHDSGHAHDDSHSHDGHGDDHGHSHDHEEQHHDHERESDRDEPPHEALVDHLVNDPIALATKASETVAMVAFFALYALDR